MIMRLQLKMLSMDISVCLANDDNAFAIKNVVHVYLGMFGQR